MILIALRRLKLLEVGVTDISFEGLDNPDELADIDKRWLFKFRFELCNIILFLCSKLLCEGKLWVASYDTW